MASAPQAEPQRRVVLSLLRVSGKEQTKNDKTGIQRQQNDIEFYCDEHNLVVEKEYSFPGISGAIVQHNPRFKEMIAHLQKPHIAGIVFASLDRFCRPDDVTAYAVFEPFVVPTKDGKSSTKKLFCDAGEVDVRSEQGRAEIIRKLEEAASERRRIKHRTLKAKEILRRDPTVSVDRLPKGVMHIKDGKRKTGHYEYTDYAREVIRPAFCAIAEGQTLWHVTKQFGFSAQTVLRSTLQNKWWIGIKHRTHKREKTFLKDEGRYKYGRLIPHENPVELRTNLAETPLVPVALFERVQAMFDRQHKTWTQRRTLVSEFVEAGILYCGHCGSRCYHKTDKRPTKPPYYICSSRWGKTANPNAKSKKTCDVPLFKLAMVRERITAEVVKRFCDTHWLSDQARKQSSIGSMQLKKAAVQRAEKQVKEIKTQLERAGKKMIEFDDRDGFLGEQYRSLKQKLADATVDHVNAESDYQATLTVTDMGAIADELREQFSRFGELAPAQQKELLNRYVDRIEIRHAVDAKGEPTLKATVTAKLPNRTLIRKSLKAVRFAAEQCFDADAKLQRHCSRTLEFGVG